MGTTTNADLDKRLHQLIGDWIEEDVTTALTASANVLCTTLNKWDDGRDDMFNGYWVYVTNKANAGEDRKIYDYEDCGGSCAVRGAVFSAETSATTMATCRFYRYSWGMGQRAINDAIREIGSDVLFKPLYDHTMVTGNWLPNAHFQDWIAASTAPDEYSLTNAAAVALTTTALFYGEGETLARVTASTADGYMYLSSLTYPRLLDLAGKTIDFKAWAYPEEDDDAFLTIYTINSAAETTTINSTTTCPALYATLLKIENQAISSDISEIQFRFRAHTKDKYVFFNHATVTGPNIYSHWLCDECKRGEIAQVWVQTVGDCHDTHHPVEYERVWNYSIVEHNTLAYLRLPYTYPREKAIRVIGTTPLSEASTAATAAFASSIEVDGRKVDLLVTYAAYCLFRNEEGVPSSEDTGRYTSRAYKYLREYERMKPALRMTKPGGTMILPRAY